jgi:hypothetical protein
MHVVTGCSASHRGTGTLALCGEPGTGKSLSFVRRTVKLSAKDLVWNRAAVDGGGANARAGDRALADALKVHGLVMNGGVHHAVEVAGEVEVQAAAAGFEYFGLHAIGEVLLRVQSDPRLRELSEATEEEANRLYWAVLPDDGELVARFERKFRNEPADFGPIDDASQAV